MTTSISMRVPVPLRQRSKRHGSRSGPSSTSLLKCPSGMPAGRAFMVASTPALGGTLTLAGGEGMALTVGAIDDFELPPERPRDACVSEVGSANVGMGGSDEFDVGAGV